MGKRKRFRKLNIDVLRESEGKVNTEELFMNDARLGMMFVRYMISNLKYLKKYEKDPRFYDSLLLDLDGLMRGLQDIDRDFKGYIRKKVEMADDGQDGE